MILSLIVAAGLGITGCSSDNGSSDNGENTGKTTKGSALSAQFIDAAVEGLAYDCQSSGKTGLTDKDGYFDYDKGDTCTFKIGSIILGSAKITGTTTPKTLTVVEPNLTNILRLLQTLDSDENLSNGITLPSNLTGTLDLGVGFDAQINDYLSKNNLQNVVVTSEDAKLHFEQTNNNSGGTPSLTKKETLKTLRAAIDSSVTAKSIYTGTGVYASYLQNNGSTDISMYKVLLVNNDFQWSFYDETTDTFKPRGNSTNVNDENETYLINGQWVTKTEDQWDAIYTYAFDSNGDANFSTWYDNRTAKIAAYDAANLNIKDIVSNDIANVITNTQTFSQGAMAYEITSEQITTNAKYTLNHSNILSLNNIQNYSGRANIYDVNGSFGVDTFGTFDSLHALIAKTSGSSSYSLRYDIYQPLGDGTSNVITGYLHFTGGDKIIFIDSWDNKTRFDGNYTIENIKGTDVLVPNFAEDNGTITGYAMHNGEVSEVYVKEDMSNFSQTTGILEDFTRTPMTSLQDFIDTNNPIELTSSTYATFALDGTIVLTNPWGTALNSNGTYEIKTIQGVEILILDIPENIISVNYDNGQNFYTFANGTLKKGIYIPSSHEVIPDSDEFFYNEIAARDIYSLVKAQTPTTSPSPSRSSSRDNTLKLGKDLKFQILP